MLGRLDAGIHPGYAALRINQITDAGGTFGIGGCNGTISDAHGPVRITQQIVGETVPVPKCLVPFRSIATDTDNGSALVLEVMDSITEPFAFSGSAGGAGLRIPPKQQPLCGKILQTDQGFILIGNGKFGGRVPNFK